jgi:hypothetical protein
MTQSAAASSYRPFATFALIWAVTSLCHQLAFTFWAQSWQGWLLVTAASASLFKPNCAARFAMLVITSVINLYNKLPFVPNHILYEGMLHLIMLLALLGFFISKRGRDEWGQIGAGWKRHLPLLLLAILLKWAYFNFELAPKGPLFGALTTLVLLIVFIRMLAKAPTMGGGDIYLARFAPVIRVAIVIMYFWAVIQKLNWDYVNPEISCAALLHSEIAAYFGKLVPADTWALHVAIWGSYFFEAGIPLLLVFRRTRYIGFYVAILFHLWLSIHPAAGIFSFSSLILGLLALFLPVKWGEELQALWEAQLSWLGRADLRKGRKIAGWIVVLVFFVTLAVQGILYLTIAKSYEVFWVANRIGWVTFFIWGLWISANYLIAGWKGRGADLALPNKAKWNLAWIGLIPVIMNGFIPWMGARTQTSFSMYSNLRSEGESNHMFLNRVDIFQFQKDMIEVLEAKPNILDPLEKPKGIGNFANIGHRIIPFFEFRRLVSESPEDVDLEVTYLRGGETLNLGRKNGQIYGNEAAFKPLPYFQYKLMWFRRLASLEEPMCCTH